MERKEQFIKDSLQDYESNLNAQELWTGIEEGLDKKDKKRRGIWFFLFLGFLILLIGFSFFIFTNKEKIEVKQNPNLQIANEIIKQGEKLDIAKAKIETDISISKNENSKTNTPHSNTLSSKKINKNINKTVIANTTRSQPNENIDNTFVKSATSSRSQINNGLDIVNEGNNNNSAPDSEEILPSFNVQKNKNDIDNAEQDINEKIDIVMDDPERDPLDDIASLQLMDCNNVNFELNQALKPLPSIDTNKVNKWALGIYGGTSFTSLNYNSLQSDLNDELIRQRNNSENLSPSLFLGIRGSRVLNIRKLENTRHQLSLETGLSYFENKFVFEGQELLESTDTIQGPVTVIENIDGTITNIIGDVIRNTSSLRNVRNINRISLLQAPLLLNYRYRLNRNMALSASSGIGLNFVQTYSGKNYTIADNELGITSLMKNNNSNDFFLSFIGEIGLVHKISKRVDLKGHLFYSSALQTNNIEETLEARVNSFGGHLGLSFSF